jgi:methionyl-tRNA formyltransferase
MADHRIIYFGMFGPLSRLPLAAILDAGITVAAVVVPPQANAPQVVPLRQLIPPPSLPAKPVSLAALFKQTVVDLAWERGLPVLEVASLADTSVLDALASYRPDLIAVSCFPYRFPPKTLALPPRGVINLHPSPLPRGRGPDPLFWLFREPEGAGNGGAGVTAHLMDRGLDSGPIVLQERFPLADGTTAQELELRAASVGAGVLVRATRALLDGTAQPRPQDEVAATAYPAPTEADYSITPDRPARWAFNFLRGTAGLGYPHRLVVGERTWLVRAARGYDPDGILSAPYIEDGDEVRVRCAPGVLAVTTFGART